MNYFKILSLFGLVILTPFISIGQSVTASINSTDRTAEMSNGIISLTINSKGQVNTLVHNNVNLLEGGGRFYFSYNESAYHELDPDLIKMGQQAEDLVEVIYVNNTGLLSIEQGFVLRKGVSGLYTYVNILSETQTVNVRELRVVHRVSPTLFDYAYTSDKVQGPMVTVSDLQNSTEVMDATYKIPDGSIYTKYDWANYVDDDLFHGLVATSTNTGVWVVSASDEYLNGGPMKQELMVHGTSKTPLALKMLQGEHFGASAQGFAPGEGKMYGPYFIYINQSNSKEGAIADAKAVAEQEVNKWPYNWMDHPEYELERATVSGQIVMTDRQSEDRLMVVLAKSGQKIYSQGKEYIFWAKAEADGKFTIPNVRSGRYSLYAFGREGEITETFEHKNIFITNGQNQELGKITWDNKSPMKKLWVIGQADRKAAEFKLGNERRRFGMWEEVPSNFEYKIDSSTPAEDWYYAQTKKGTWNVSFVIDDTLKNEGNAMLHVGIAGATGSKVEVSVNGSKIRDLSFDNDGSVYRSANTGGRYDMRTLTFPESRLKTGRNSISFKLTDVGSRGGVMYDVIKLEVPDTSEPVVEPLGHSDLDEETLKVYPNPATTNVNALFILNQPANVKIQLLDLSGRMIQQWPLGNLNKGSHFRDVDVSEFMSGTYLFRIVSDQGLLAIRPLIIE